MKGLDGAQMFAEFSAGGGRRQIGTHVPFEWLPTSAIQTPEGQAPCKVVHLVREPKECFVGQADYKYQGDLAGLQAVPARPTSSQQS
jgi:hypothetical protein